jgi:hypothetical protein
MPIIITSGFFGLMSATGFDWISTIGVLLVWISGLLAYRYRKAWQNHPDLRRLLPEVVQGENHWLLYALPRAAWISTLSWLASMIPAFYLSYLATWTPEKDLEVQRAGLNVSLFFFRFVVVGVFFASWMLTMRGHYRQQAQTKRPTASGSTPPP